MIENYEAMAKTSQLCGLVSIYHILRTQYLLYTFDLRKFCRVKYCRDKYCCVMYIHVKYCRGIALNYNVLQYVQIILIKSSVIRKVATL